MVRYSLKFVNNGAPFEMPNWTPEKHELALSKLEKGTKGMSEEQKNSEFKYYVIYETLSNVDPNCKIDDIRNMHPLDLVELFKAVYNAGREGIYFREGSKPKKRKKQKSTGKTN